MKKNKMTTRSKLQSGSKYKIKTRKAIKKRIKIRNSGTIKIAFANRVHKFLSKSKAHQKRRMNTLSKGSYSKSTMKAVKVLHHNSK